MSRKSRTVLATGLGVVLSVCAAAPAEAAASISGVGPGRLVARGAAATAPVTFVCEAGKVYSLGFELHQAVGAITTGSGTGFFGSCTGQPQTLVLGVAAYPAPFRRDVAAALVSLDLCCDENGSYYESQRLVQEINLR